MKKISQKLRKLRDARVIHKSMLLKIWEFHHLQYPELKQTVVQQE